MAKDRNGNDVKIGSKVKVLNIDPSVWERLPEKEQEDLKSMIGEVLEVYEVSDQYASVEKWWRDDEHHSHSHSIALRSEEMELVL